MVQRVATLLCLLVTGCYCGFGLDPALDISQYAHTAWTAREGLKGITRSIVQTRDGYLWLGTEFGLVRFDGVRFVPWIPSVGHLPSNNIRSLLAARDGTLWIGTVEGLASWKNGQLNRYAEVAGQNVLTLFEDHEGTVWAGTFGTPNGKLCAIQRGIMKCWGDDGILGQWVYTVYEKDAQMWVHTGHGLWRWKPGTPKRYFMRLPGSFESSHTLVQSDSGAGLIAISDGRLRQMVQDKISDYPLSIDQRDFTALNLLRDANGALWIGTLNHGLLRVHNGKTSFFAQSDGLSGDRILSLFEDREGTIWVGTGSGLDSFREFAVPSISAKQGLSSPTIMAVLAARDNSVWLSGVDGISRWNNGRLAIYHARGKAAAERSPFNATRQALPVTEITDPELPDDEAGSLFEDERARIWVSTPAGIARFESGRFTRVRDLPGGWVNTIISDGNGGLWISYQDYGLVRVMDDKVVERIPWSKFGANVIASSLLTDSIHRGLWIGFFQGGLLYFKDGQVRARYGKAEGLGNGRVTQLQLDVQGTLWVATEGGLSRVKEGHVATLTSSNGLPCDTVHWTEDDASSVWLYTACGLFRIARTELDTWASDPTHKVRFMILDSSDGVRSHALLTGYTPRVSKSADGRLWFAHIEGVSVVDPQHLAINNLPPPVHVEQITVDGKAYNPARELRLHPRVRNLTVDYTALSFVAPEKVHFRFKLEGQDSGWREVVNDRQVEYSNLSPGPYRFRVIACNNSGLWNEQGDTLNFSIDPAYYQTNWFRALCAAVFLALIWVAYRWRVGQLARDFNLRVEARVNERSRIARELHDTLLQSFQASLVQMQVARTLVSRKLAQALEPLDQAISMTEIAIADGRDAIQGLRTQSSAKGNLLKLLTLIGKELEGSQNGRSKTATFQVSVEGERAYALKALGGKQNLNPLIQDEAYRIACELLRNAYKHANASQIEAEIRYEHRAFRLRIRDDGKGIDPRILTAGGRRGHWGLTGMRERAKQLGGHLEIWSQTGAGTEVELSIPGAIAYESGNGRGRFRLFRRKDRDRE